MTPSEREAALVFLRAVHPEIPDDCAIIIWTLKDRRSHWATSHEQAVELADAAGGQDVYVGCCLQPRGLGPRTRGKAATALVVPGFWADVDFMCGDAHKGKQYPPTKEDAQALCEALPWLPTVLVHSGHGLQAWWLVKELWEVRDQKDRAEAARLVAGWQALLSRRAVEKGWTIDSTQDLARILRLPGTWNTKDASALKRVRSVYLQDDRRYIPEDADDYFPADLEMAVQPPAKKKTKGSGGDSGQGWVLNPQGMAPPEKLSLALAQVEGFAETWRRKRKLHGPRGDQSLSAFDFSLAIQMVQLGWTDQQIVDGLVQFRREQGDPKLRIDYYRTTLAKARQAGAPSELEEAIEEWEVKREEAAQVEQARMPLVQPQDDDVTDTRGTFVRVEVSDDKREAARKVVSGWLGLRVERVEQTRSEDPLLTLVTERGTIKIGNLIVFQRQASFRAVVALLTHEQPPKLKAKQWDPPMLNALWDLTIEVDVGTEATPRGRALAKVGAYLKRRAPLDLAECDDDTHIMPGRPLLVDEDVWFSGEDFGEWHNDHYRGERLTARDQGMMLRALGGRQGTKRWPKAGSGRGIVVKAWRIPIGTFSDDDGE